MDLNNLTTLASISNSIIKPSVPRPLKKLNQGEPMALGITQILIGILEIAFGLVIAIVEQIYEYRGGSHITSPYWTGIPYIISGSLSVAAAQNPKMPVVKGMLGMNIVSAVAAGIAIVILSISIEHKLYMHSYRCFRTYDTMLPEFCDKYFQSNAHMITYTSAILLVFTVLEFFITIVSAAFGCASLCRNTYSETTVVIFQNADREAAPAVLTPVKEDEVP